MSTTSPTEKKMGARLRDRALLLVLSFCNLKELLVFRRVSRGWREAAESALSLLETAILNHRRLVAAAARFCCRLQTLHATALMDYAHSRLAELIIKNQATLTDVEVGSFLPVGEAVTRAIDKCASLRRLRYPPESSKRAAAIAPLIERFPGLTSLSVVVDLDEKDIQAATALLSAREPPRWKQLRALKLGLFRTSTEAPDKGSWLTELGGHGRLPSLVHLTISSGLDCPEACAVLRAFPGLTSLTIRNTGYPLTASEDLWDLASCPPPPGETHNLEELALLSSDPTMLNVLVVTFQFPQLRRVEIDTARPAGVEFNPLPALLCFRKSLQELRISQCECFEIAFPKDFSAEERAGCFPRLRSVCFEGEVEDGVLPFQADKEVVRALTPAKA